MFVNKKDYSGILSLTCYLLRDNFCNNFFANIRSDILPDECAKMFSGMAMKDSMFIKETCKNYASLGGYF